MSHNTSNTIAFTVWHLSIVVLVIFASPWFILLLFVSPSFKTDKEIEATQSKERQS